MTDDNNITDTTNTDTEPANTEPTKTYTVRVYFRDRLSNEIAFANRSVGDPIDRAEMLAAEYTEFLGESPKTDWVRLDIPEDDIRLYTRVCDVEFVLVIPDQEPEPSDADSDEEDGEPVVYQSISPRAGSVIEEMRQRRAPSSKGLGPGFNPPDSFLQ